MRQGSYVMAVARAITHCCADSNLGISIALQVSSTIGIVSSEHHWPDFKASMSLCRLSGRASTRLPRESHLVVVTGLPVVRQLDLHPQV
jgi:hypothetical protein